MHATQAYEYLIDIFDSAYRRLYQFALPPPGPESGLAGSGAGAAAGGAGGEGAAAAVAVTAAVTVGPAATATQKLRNQFCRTPEPEPVTEFAFRGPATTPGYRDVARLLAEGGAAPAGPGGEGRAAPAFGDPGVPETEEEVERLRESVEASLREREAPGPEGGASGAGAAEGAAGREGAEGPREAGGDPDSPRSPPLSPPLSPPRSPTRPLDGPSTAPGEAPTPFALKGTGRTPRPLRETLRQGGELGASGPAGGSFPTPQLLGAGVEAEGEEGEGAAGPAAPGAPPGPQAPARSVAFREDRPLSELTSRGQALRALEAPPAPPPRPVISLDADRDDSRPATPPAGASPAPRPEDLVRAKEATPYRRPAPEAGAEAGEDA